MRAESESEGVREAPQGRERPGRERPGGPSRHLATWLFRRLAHWHWVDAGLARSAQLYGVSLTRLLEGQGIRTVINLRGRNARKSWYQGEKAACAALGIAHHDVQMKSRFLPARADLLTLVHLLEHERRPILVKCASGADRTGLVAGLYLLQKDGPEGLPAARGQLAAWPYLHLPYPRQRWIKAFFAFYAEDSRGRALAPWIDEAYTPQRFAAYMRDQGMGEAWRDPAVRVRGLKGRLRRKLRKALTSLGSLRSFSAFSSFALRRKRR